MERPRSKGARWTNKFIAADEKVEDINLGGFEAKRDRWNGYDAAEWAKQAEKFDKIAEIRKELRQQELLEKKFKGNLKEEDLEDGGAGTDSEDEDADHDEEDKIGDTEEADFAKVERRVRSQGGAATGSVRNLRIREDTAKYLLNLDIDSAYYDPKSRSMRMDPNPDKDPARKTFAGDNFIRSTGTVQGFNDLNVFSITAYDKGQDVHLQAMPSQAELAYQQFRARKEELAKGTTQDILSKYGNAAEKPSEDVLALKATEAYVEYDASGRVIRGQEVKARSRYEEDIYPGNHKSVWGSYWIDGQWGYACCNQTVKNSYCTGTQGQAAAAEAANLLERNLEGRAEEEEKRRQELEDKRKNSTLEGHKPAAAGIWGTEADKEDVALDPEKLKSAIKRQEEADRRGAEMDDRKRGYNSISGGGMDVSVEEMEAYRLKKSRGDDPLAAINKVKAAQNGGYDFV